MKQKLLNKLWLRVGMIVAIMTTALSGTAWGAEDVYKTALFGSSYNSQSIGSYTATWSATNAGFTVNLANFNNNNNSWNYVKCGRKNNTSVATIITADAIDKAITKVVVTIDAITASNVNSIKLYTSSNGSSWTEAGSFTKATGAQAVALSSPAANLYYKVEFDCASGSSNGLVTVSKVEYYHSSSAAATSVSIDDSGITNTDVYGGTAAGSLSATVTAGGNVVAGATVTWSGNNDAVATINSATGAVTLVSAGTVTFTAEYAGATGQYVGSSDSYEMTVTNTTPQYNVTYKANGGTGNDVVETYYEGEDVTVASNPFARVGYSFTKWNTAADGSGTEYDPNDVIEDIDDDVDLYAQWEASAETTATITFSSSDVAINAASVTGDDNIDNEWTITTAGTTSFTNSNGFGYSQVGSGSKPATSITFTTTLAEDVNVTAFSAKFGGFSGTAGAVTLKVDDVSVGTGSLNATNDVTVLSESSAIGKTLTVTVTGISKGVKCYYISYTYEAATTPVVPKPTFTVAEGTYEAVQNVKVSNYDDDYMYFYTTDGTTPDCDANLDPTGTSVAYNHTNGINISATTTLKMIAADIDGNKSAVAEVEYTFPTIYTTIAAFMEANTTGYLNLTGAQVVYIDAAKKNIYVRDASGAVDLYNSSGFTTSLTTGDILSGTIYGKYSPYKNLPEIQNIEDISVLTATSNQTVVAKVIDGTTAAIAANLCDLVKIVNTEISESNSKYYVGDNSDIQLFDNFSVGYTVTTGKAVDVSGIATVYNDTYELFPRFTEDIVYLETSEAVSISSSLGYSTYCSDNNLDFTAVDAIKVFYATVEGSTLRFTRIYKVAAGTGVLLVSAAGSAVAETHVPFFTDAAGAVTNNVFVRGAGTAVTYADDNQNYILFDGKDGIGFYRANNNTVATNRAYIHLTSSNPVKSFAIDFDDDATGISLMEDGRSQMEDGVIYNLAGQRISKMQKGINIVNGKKILK